MGNTRVRIAQAWGTFRTAYKSRKWVRVATAALVCLGFYSGGVSQGHKETDPRTTGGPGATVTEDQLRGKWDGVLTTKDGRGFCMVGWPCEDSGLDD